MSASKRRLSSVRLTRRFHFQHMGLWIVISVALVVLVNLLLYLLVQQQWGYSGVFEGEGADPGISITRGFTALLVVETLLFSLALIWMARFTSHRIAGAFIGLQHTCERVAAGEREARQKFRDYDRLDDLERAFNHMLDTLQQRPPSR